jgi:hypothetical protein
VLEIEQEVRPVAGEPVLLKVSEGEREGMVDADDGRDVPVEFLAEPFGETPPSPVTPWARWRLNLFRRAEGIGNVSPESLATGVCCFRTGVVDADVAAKCVP